LRRSRLLLGIIAVVLVAAGGLVAAGPRLQDEGYDVPWLAPKTPYVADLKATVVGQGELGAVHVAPALKPDLQAVAGSITGLRGVSALRFAHLERSWVALIPVSYNNQPGDYPIALTITDHKGRTHEATLTITVETSTFTTSSQYLQLSPAINSLRTPDKIAEDAAKTAAAKAAPALEPLWTGPFVQPVESDKVTTEFGHGRYINGVFQGRHSGIDWGSVGTGAPVIAANSGKVVLATMLHASGNTVMIDHGLGLFSSYLHLSAIEVAVGDMVAAGDLIGLTGSTGVSTGPHLHFTLWVGDVATNPWPWFEHDPMELLILDRGD